MSCWGRRERAAGWALGCQAGSTTTAIYLFEFFTLAFPIFATVCHDKKSIISGFSTSIFLTPVYSLIPAIKMHFLAEYFRLFLSILNIIKITYWCSIPACVGAALYLQVVFQTCRENSGTQNTLFSMMVHLKSTCLLFLLKKENVTLTGKGNI